MKTILSILILCLLAAPLGRTEPPLIGNAPVEGSATDKQILVRAFDLLERWAKKKQVEKDPEARAAIESCAAELAAVLHGVKLPPLEIVVPNGSSISADGKYLNGPYAGYETWRPSHPYIKWLVSIGYGGGVQREDGRAPFDDARRSRMSIWVRQNQVIQDQWALPGGSRATAWAQAGSRPDH